MYIQKLIQEKFILLSKYLIQLKVYFLSHYVIQSKPYFPQPLYSISATTVFSLRHISHYILQPTASQTLHYAVCSISATNLCSLQNHSHYSIQSYSTFPKPLRYPRRRIFSILVYWWIPLAQTCIFLVLWVKHKECLIIALLQSWYRNCHYHFL